MDRKDKQVMENIKNKVNEYVQVQEVLKRPIKKNDLQVIVDNTIGRKSKLPQTLVEDWRKMMDDMRKGDILIKKTKKRYKSGTIDRYSDNLDRLIRFSEDEGIPLRYDKIDKKWVDRLFSWAIKQNFSQNTIALLAAQFRSFLNMMHSDGRFSDLIHEEEYLKYSQEEVDDIALYEDEIIKIYNTEGLTKAQVRARDIFCFGCCVGLRVDDLNRINQYHLVNDVFEFFTEKGSKRVLIPIHWLAKEIYDKYKGKLPTYLSRAALGPHLPKICRKAGITEQVLIVSTVGGITKGEYYEKCDLVKPHTMRRSFATNAILARIPDNLVMEITGHGDWDTFKRYIKITEDRKIKALKDHPWFKGHQQIGLTGSDGK